MKLNFKTILIITGVLIIIAVLAWPGSTKIDSVIDGSTVLLDNGVEVNLIGINSTTEAAEELERLMKEGVELEIIPDSKSPFDVSKLSEGDVVYAYLDRESNGSCINEELLKSGLTTLLDDPYLFDRRARFVAIASEVGPTTPNPTPTPARKIDYSEDDIELPSYHISTERKHSNWYIDGNLNLEMLDEACDYDVPYTKSFANQLAARSEGVFNPGQICEIFDYCYKKWRYVNDPKGKEYVAKASESIYSSLTGDCDDFAILMASCLLAVGADVCVNTGSNAAGGHAFTEVDISCFDLNTVLQVVQDKFDNYNISSLHTRHDNGRVWLNLDWQASYPGGMYYDCSYGRDAYPCINGIWQWDKIK